MKCQNCGTEFEGIFCPECGTKCISEDNSNELSLAEKKKQALEMEMRKKESEARILAERRQQQADIESRKRQEEIELSKQKTEQERLATEKAKYEAELARQKAEQEKAIYMQEQQKKNEALAAERKIANEGKNDATGSLICGILALMTVGAFVFPEVLGIIFAKKGKKDGKMRKAAKAGLICSLASIALFVLIIIFAFISEPSSSSEQVSSPPPVESANVQAVYEEKQEIVVSPSPKDEHAEYQQAENIEVHPTEPATVQETVEIAADTPLTAALERMFHLPYLDAVNIKINDAAEYRNTIKQIVKTLDSSPVDIKVVDGHFSLSSSEAKYLYYGKMKDNRPDGFGVLVLSSVDNEGIPYFLYAGEFEDGKCSGYGVQFKHLEDESFARQIGSMVDEITAENRCEHPEQISMYLKNHVIYEGNFKSGSQSGEGTCFGVGWQINSLNGYWAVDVYPDILIGKFSAFSNICTSGKIYYGGSLYYEGDLNGWDPDGKGTSYYENGKKEYDGQWKNGQYDGTGTLYDENGKKIYSGKWKDGDYNA